MITLFGNLESGNVHKVQLILHYIHRPFRRVEVYQTLNQPRRPEFLQLNPIGKIPVVLLDNGDILSESNAILFYFAQDTSLWPDEPRAQTEVLRWLFFEQYSHEPTLSGIRYLSRYTENPQQHTEQIQRLKPKARYALEAMENQLRKHRWLTSDSCSIADYALYPYTRFADESGFNLTRYPDIERWMSQSKNNPIFCQ